MQRFVFGSPELRLETRRCRVSTSIYAFPTCCIKNNVPGSSATALRTNCSAASSGNSPATGIASSASAPNRFAIFTTKYCFMSFNTELRAPGSPYRYKPRFCSVVVDWMDLVDSVDKFIPVHKVQSMSTQSMPVSVHRVTSYPCQRTRHRLRFRPSSVPVRTGRRLLPRQRPASLAIRRWAERFCTSLQPTCAKPA